MDPYALGSGDECPKSRCRGDRISGNRIPIISSRTLDKADSVCYNGLTKKRIHIICEFFSHGKSRYIISTD